MDTTVMLGHGSGGTMMKRIIDDVFFAAYAGDELLRGDDAAVLPAPAPGERLAFSTDSFVVTPHFFPGGDIGRLAVCGTVNDVATSGAVPRYLSCGFVLEEGFPIEDLKRICASMAECAQEAGVHLVTGDTKVVNRGHGDGVYINTSGVGTIPEGVNLGGAQCKPGDKVLVTGTLGDHGITIMSCRESLSFSADLESDAAPLNHLIAEVLAAAPNTRCFRDPTRGGLASTLNELAAQSNTDITVEEDAIPVKPAVRGACEMLGYDVLQVANEGKMVCVVAAEEADAALAAMRANRPALLAARRAAAFAPFAAALRDVQAARARDAACALARMASRARAFADRGVLGEGLNASRLDPQDAAQPLGVRRSPRSADGKVVRARSLGTLRRRIARATRAPFAVAAKPSCAVRSDSPRAAAQPPSASSPLRSRVCAGFAAFAVSPTRSAAGRAAFWRSAARSRVFTFLATTRSLMSLGKAASFLLRHSPGFVVMRR